VRRLAEDDAADLVLVQVRGDAQHAARELEELVGHRARKTLDARDAVAALEHAPHLLTLDGR
jgi:hypothetical protein